MRLLAIDPGEMTGWARFTGREKVAGGQTPWGQFLDDLAEGLLEPPYGRYDSEFNDIDLIVVEDFVIYPAGVGDGPPPPWDHVITARLIGGIQTLANLAGVNVEYQGADCKTSGRAALGEEALVRPLYPNRHENDAAWHGAYYLARHPEALTAEG